MRLYRIALAVYIFICLLLAASSEAGVSETAVSSGHRSEYVETFDGDMPLLFAVGHGGWEQVGEQENGGWSADPLLRNYFHEILLLRLYEKTGHLPYIVYQHGNRNYVNTNRPVGSSQAYHPDNTEAQTAYFEFHDEVESMIGRMESVYGTDLALFINPHSTDLSADVGSRPWDRIAEIGFITSVTNLGSSSNAMKALYDRQGETALRGETSIPYQWFHAQEWPTLEAVWPEAATVNSKTLSKTGDDVWHVLPAWVTGYGVDDWVTSYYNGSSTIQYHGTNASGHHANWTQGLDACQVEINFTRSSGISLLPTDPEHDPEGPYYQLDVSFAASLLDDFIDAILYCLETNYSWTPWTTYNAIVDNGGLGFSTTGSWEESSGKGYWGSPSSWIDEAGETATWTPDLTETGVHEVLIRWTKAGTRTYDARYTVFHDAGSDTFVIDQSSDNDARWISLGNFPLSPGRGGSVQLECTGTGSSTAADATLFIYRPDSLYADFTADVTSGIAPLVVNFTDLSVGNATSWSWDCTGNGEVDATAENPSYTYTEPGTYSVSLTVANAAGNATKTKSSYITVTQDPSDTCETRAVWLNHYAFDSSEKRTETLQKITDANLNTVFLIVPDDARPAWSTVADFSAMLTEAKALDLSVHVWMINMWRTEGQPADFTDPAEQEAQKQWALALLDTFPALDGVHFDYIRYQTQDRLDSLKMRGIRQTVLQTYQAMQTEHPGRFLTAALISLGQDCADWVHSYPEGGDDIPSWFQTWFPANPGNRWDDLSFCSAYPTPDGVPTQMTFQQDGVSLVNNDALDFLFSMEYTYYTSWWTAEVDIWNSFLGSAIGHVYMGLGWYGSVWNGAGVTPEEVAAEILNKIAYGRMNGIDGFSIFEFGEPGTNDSIVIQALTQGPSAPFAEPAPSCLLSQPFAEFTADTMTGTAPLAVQYLDLSTGAVASWEWDLDGDDVVDSTSRNPSFIYVNPGTYTVSLMVINGENDDTKIKENFITVFALDTPEITAVSVVANEITIAWNPVSGATSYAVYSSVMPYTGFALDTMGTFNGESWQAPVSGDEGFFYVTAMDAVYESDASTTVGFVIQDLP